MKRLLGIILVLCMALACAPAMAVNGYQLNTMPYVLNLSHGPVLIERPPFENWSTYFSQPIGYMDMTMTVIEVTGAFKRISYKTYQDENDEPVEIYEYSLNNDSTADLRYTLSRAGLLLEALPGATCPDRVTKDLPWTPEEQDFDLTYYSPLTVIIRPETCVIDLRNGPVTFSGDESTQVNNSFMVCDMSGVISSEWPAGSKGLIDLDRDGTADISIGYPPSGGSLVLEALDTANVRGEFVISVPEQSGSAYPIYSKMKFILPLNLPEAYSDSTGSYAITEDGEAIYQKPAKKTAASVKIPAAITVNGMSVPVTKIADNAFKGQKKLTKVTIGANIREIGKNAFANCAKLKTVSGGANVEIIGDSAFSGCKKLTKFTIGAKVTKIGKKAFYKCAALKKLTIKSTLLTAKTVGSSAFKGINANATIKVPKAVKKDYTKWLLKKGVKKTMKIK